MRRFVFHYDYKEPNSDTFECEAESLEDAWELFDRGTEDYDDVEVSRHTEDEPPPLSEPEDPAQMKFDFNEPTTGS